MNCGEFTIENYHKVKWHDYHNRATYSMLKRNLYYYKIIVLLITRCLY